MSAFNRYNPFINFIFFSMVIIFTMALMHPIFLLISFLFSFGYAISLEGKRAMLFLLRILPISFLSILINVLFNHRGSTIVCYFANGNPFTLESLIFGISASFMILSTIFWFYSFHRIVTSDKILYIFGKTFPSVSLLLSMILRFVPRLVRESKEIINGQKCLEICHEKHHTLRNRLLNAKSILLAEITLAFENAINTANAMRMRGFREKKRNTYAVYRMNHQDVVLGTIFGIGFLLLFIGIYRQYAYYRYFPSFQWTGITYQSIFLVGVYIVLVSMPFLLEIGEIIKWRKLK